MKRKIITIAVSMVALTSTTAFSMEDESKNISMSPKTMEEHETQSLPLSFTLSSMEEEKQTPPLSPQISKIKTRPASLSRSQKGGLLDRYTGPNSHTRPNSQKMSEESKSTRSSGHSPLSQEESIPEKVSHQSEAPKDSIEYYKTPKDASNSITSSDEKLKRHSVTSSMSPGREATLSPEIHDNGELQKSHSGSSLSETTGNVVLKSHSTRTRRTDSKSFPKKDKKSKQNLVSSEETKEVSKRKGERSNSRPPRMEKKLQATESQENIKPVSETLEILVQKEELKESRTRSNSPLSEGKDQIDHPQIMGASGDIEISTQKEENQEPLKTKEDHLNAIENFLQERKFLMGEKEKEDAAKEALVKVDIWRYPNENNSNNKYICFKYFHKNNNIESGFVDAISVVPSEHNVYNNLYRQEEVADFEKFKGPQMKLTKFIGTSEGREKRLENGIPEDKVLVRDPRTAYAWFSGIYSATNLSGEYKYDNEIPISSDDPVLESLQKKGKT